MEHVEKARALFLKGYNCAQSVFAAYCDQTGLDEETALKLSSSFGGGIGRLREVCGAFSAMAMVAGMLSGYTDPSDQAKKAAHYEFIQSLSQKFKEKNGTLICRELLALPKGASLPTPEARTAAYYERRPCAELVASAAEILDQWLAQKQ